MSEALYEFQNVLWLAREPNCPPEILLDYLIGNPSFPVELVESEVTVISGLNEECRNAVVDRLMGTTKYAGLPKEWIEAKVFG